MLILYGLSFKDFLFEFIVGQNVYFFIKREIGCYKFVLFFWDKTTNLHRTV